MSEIRFNFVWSNLHYKCYTNIDTYWSGIVHSGLSKPYSRYTFVKFLFVTLLYSELQGYSLISMTEPLFLWVSDMYITIFVA